MRIKQFEPCEVEMEWKKQGVAVAMRVTCECGDGNRGHELKCK